MDKLIWLVYLFRRGHYQRPLEEAIQTHMSQWPKAWQGKNPLHGGGSFATMTPEERVCFDNFHPISIAIIYSNVSSSCCC